MDNSSGMIPSFKTNRNPGIQFDAGDRKAIRDWAEKNLMSNGREVRDFDSEKIKKLSSDQRAVVIAAFHGEVPGNKKINQARVKEIVDELKNLENDATTEKSIISKTINSFKKAVIDQKILKTHIGINDVGGALNSYDFEAKEARSTEKTKAVEALYNEANSIDRLKRKVAKTALLVLKSSDINEKHFQTLANHDVMILTDEGGRAIAMVRKVAQTLLGSGSFKDVYKAIDSKGETAVGFGRYFNNVEGHKIDVDQWELEVKNETRAVSLLNGKRENFILPSKVTFVANGIKQEALIMPRAETDGWNWLSQHPSNQERADLMTHLLDAVKVLENTSCVHFDLKLENMLNHAGRWKISDFGSLFKLEGEKKVQPAITTPGYEAPEIVAGLGGDTKASCFTAGVMLAEVCGFHIIREKFEEYRTDPAALEAYINQFRDVLMNRFDSLLLDVIVELLEPIPENRLSAHEAAEILKNINIAKHIDKIQASFPESESEIYGPFATIEDMATAVEQNDANIVDFNDAAIVSSSKNDKLIRNMIKPIVDLYLAHKEKRWDDPINNEELLHVLNSACDQILEFSNELSRKAGFSKEEDLKLICERICREAGGDRLMELFKSGFLAAKIAEDLLNHRRLE